MDVRPGYKLTEIGIIPEDWDAVPLGDLFTFKNGLNKAKKYFGYGTPIVNYMDVFGRPGLRLDHIKGRVDVSRSELEGFEVRKGDVFFTRTSETVEEIGVAAAMLDPAKDTVFSGFVLRARPTDDSLDDHFKAYCFSPKYFRQQVIARATYTTRALTNGRSLSATILARPPRAEQESIAEALSDVDAAIAAIRRLIAKKRDLRTGAMQRLLTGESRLPGFTAPWQEKRLGELGRFLKGSGVPRGAAFSGELPCIRYGEVYTTHHNVVRQFTSRISRAVANNATRIQFRDLLFAGSGETKEEIGKCVALTTDVEAYAGGDIIILRPYGGDPVFLGYLMNIPQVARQKANRGQGDAVVHVSARALASVEVLLPDEREQEAIAEVLSDMEAEIAALEARLAKTRDLKQAMMQALLTGRVRLPVSAVETCEPEAAHG
ncbi:restriction endonuclease subunit S [Stappia sp. TSB10GB4]|uniref:restriction endonuclease subunit S n=1 Tax=Stappia sp. TSB10GB4 TaxID=2003584 RepID=UPI0016440269|nr:restriction endonuclease subunit S [Stappia sp. TSB10GB4]